MRITDVMLRTSGLANVKSAMGQIARTQEQLASGKKVLRISDDPIAAEAIMRAHNETTLIAQYERNVLAIRNRQTVEESVVTELTSIIEDARQVGLTEGSATRSASTRLASENIVRGMIDHVITLGNTRVGNDYVFSGREIDQPAFDAAGAYQGDLELWEIEIDKGFRHTPNNTGQRVFIDSDLLPALEELADRLAANDTTGILAATERLRLSFNDMQTLLADVGSRSEVTFSTESLHGLNKSHLAQHRSSYEDIDLAETITHLASMQVSLNGAMSAVQEALSLDFLSMTR